MNKFSQVIVGIVIAGVGALIGSFGLSDACSNEILAKATPVLTTIPGLIWAWVARVKQGDVSPLGRRKV